MAGQRDPHRRIRQGRRHAAMHDARNIPVMIAHRALQRDTVGMSPQHTNANQFIEWHVLRRES